MDKTEAAQIAYAAVQVSCTWTQAFAGALGNIHFALQVRWGISSKTWWSKQDGNFNYHEFSYSIIDIISSCQDVSWKDTILKHYNMYVF